MWDNVFVLFFFVTRSGRWQWTSSSSSSSSSAVHRLRPLTHTLFSVSLSRSLSLSLFFFLFSPSLSLSTDNNNFTKDKVLAKQQRAKQKPKKKKRDRDFWGRFIRKIFWADRFPSFQWRLVQPRRKTKKIKKLTRIPLSTWLQIAPRLPFAKPHHTNKSTPFFASPIQSVKKSTTTFSQYLSFFLPAHSPQLKSLLK